MTDWPQELAPSTSSIHGREPITDWWGRVRNQFPWMPEDVAEQWLYENWGSSPYYYLIFRPYDFDLVQWKADELSQIRERNYDWEEGSARSKAHGRQIIKNLDEYDYRTGLYMIEHGSFPRPLIVLDNRDGHLRNGVDPVPKSARLPAAYMLIEGHRRFQMGLYLHETGRLNPSVPIWIMRPLG